jgi:probable F420-dependent oxidoreductase
MGVRVGIGLFTAQLPASSKRSFEQEYRETLELVRLAERVGFDSAWVSEHHGSSDGYLPSLLPMLAAFAAVTERIQLGTGVILTPLHDPLRLAEDAAVVDQLSGGRLLLGIGNGWREEEFRMFDASRAERGARTQETIEVLRRAWTGRRFSFEGRTLRYDRVRVTPQPARPGGPPILLGGYDRKAVIRAGRLADGYITDETGPDEVRGNLELVADGARGAGRDPDTMMVVLLQNAFPWRDGDPWPLIRDGVVQQLGAYEAWGEGADTPEHDRLEPAKPSEEDLRLSTPAGPPDEVARTLLATIRAAGDRDVHLVVRLHYPGMDLETASRATELFAAEVIPALKSV